MFEVADIGRDARLKRYPLALNLNHECRYVASVPLWVVSARSERKIVIGNGGDKTAAAFHGSNRA